MNVGTDPQNSQLSPTMILVLLSLVAAEPPSYNVKMLHRIGAESKYASPRIGLMIQPKSSPGMALARERA